MSDLSGEAVIVTLSGKQSPGALANVMRVLGTEDSPRLVDFGQLVVRNRYIATALISSPGAQTIVKDILFRAQASDIQVDFNFVSTKHSSTSSLVLPGDEYVLTVFSPGRISAEFLAKVTGVLLRNDVAVVAINRLTEDGEAYMCLEFIIRIDARDDELSILQHELFEVGRKQRDCDMALQRADVSRKVKRMVVFDLSWTLVQCDAVDVLLREAGRAVADEVEEAWMRGELSRPEWLKERVKVLKGVQSKELNAKVAKKLKYTNGAVELCKGLKRLGCRLAVVSSGSKLVAETAKDELGLDYSFGNSFEVDSNNCFTGIVNDPIIDTDRKAELVQMLTMKERIDLEQVIAVGDGPVSSKMLKVVGMSIAFDQPDAEDGNFHSGRISSKSLASVLYLLGVTGHDFKQVTEG